MSYHIIEKNTEKFIVRQTARDVAIFFLGREVRKYTVVKENGDPEGITADWDELENFDITTIEAYLEGLGEVPVRDVEKTVKIVSMTGTTWDALKAIVEKHPECLAELKAAGLMIHTTEVPLYTNYVNSDGEIVSSFMNATAEVPLPIKG